MGSKNKQSTCQRLLKLVAVLLCAVCAWTEAFAGPAVSTNGTLAITISPATRTVQLPVNASGNLVATNCTYTCSISGSPFPVSLRLDAINRSPTQPNGAVTARWTPGPPTANNRTATITCNVSPAALNNSFDIQVSASTVSSNTVNRSARLNVVRSTATNNPPPVTLPPVLPNTPVNTPARPQNRGNLRVAGRIDGSGAGWIRIDGFYYRPSFSGSPNPPPVLTSQLQRAALRGAYQTTPPNVRRPSPGIFLWNTGQAPRNVPWSTNPVPLPNGQAPPRRPGGPSTGSGSGPSGQPGGGGPSGGGSPPQGPGG